jgi:O-acetylhomoserine/O-acetylserine sulfhydrylase-like pyridoxal-dependent enzyme
MPTVDDAVAATAVGAGFAGVRTVFFVVAGGGGTVFCSTALYPHLTHRESKRLGLIRDAISPEAHGRLTHSLPITVACEDEFGELALP